MRDWENGRGCTIERCMDSILTSIITSRCHLCTPSTSKPRRCTMSTFVNATSKILRILASPWKSLAFHLDNNHRTLEYKQGKSGTACDQACGKDNQGEEIGSAIISQCIPCDGHYERDWSSQRISSMPGSLGHVVDRKRKLTAPWL